AMSCLRGAGPGEYGGRHLRVAVEQDDGDVVAMRVRVVRRVPVAAAGHGPGAGVPAATEVDAQPSASYVRDAVGVGDHDAAVPADVRPDPGAGRVADARPD